MISDVHDVLCEEHDDGDSDDFQQKKEKMSKKCTFSCIYRKLVVILRVVWFLGNSTAPKTVKQKVRLN